MKNLDFYLREFILKEINWHFTLLEFHLETNLIKAIRVLQKNKSFVVRSVNFLYEAVGQEKLQAVRSVLEQMLGNDESADTKEGLNKADTFQIFKLYPENEKDDVEYSRNLFRRISYLKWKKKQAKEMFQIWMTFEKENGNTQEAPAIAKKHVTTHFAE